MEKEGAMTGQAIKKIAVALLLMVGMYAAVIFGMKLVGKYLATKSANRDDVKAELEQAKQDAKKLDPEGKRIVLTEEYLKAEYKDYYASKVEGNNFVLGIICIIGMVFIVAGVIGFIAALLSSRFSIRKSIGMLLPVLIAVGVIWFLQKTPLFKLPPHPDDVTCKLDEVKISRKNTKTKQDSDDDGYSSTSTTYYYIYFNDENGKEHEFSVTDDTYKELKVNDLCYVAAAKSGDEIVYYRRFDHIGKVYLLPGE